MTTPSPRRWFGVTLVFALVVGVGCSRLHINPPDDVVRRTWLNTAPSPDSQPDTNALAVAGLSGQLTPEASVSLLPARPLNVLALSGGGKFGTFGAGLLCGWTAQGTRPTFDVVTGVSSGSLTGLYAFLGPKYDEKMKANYLTVTHDRLFSYCLYKIPRTGAITSSRPFAKVIAKETPPEVLADLRAAHAEGRRLYVATNNLTLHKLTIWDVGAIASSGRPDADELVRKIFLAACSIPGWVPAVEFDVVVDGKRYKELHTDAGSQAQVFVQTPNGLSPGSNVYVVTAGKFYMDPMPMRPMFVGMVMSGVTESLYSLYRADVMNIYSLCAATQSRFHTIALPASFQMNPSSLAFNAEELQRLFTQGYCWGEKGIPWEHTPPGTRTGETIVPRTGLEFMTK